MNEMPQRIVRPFTPSLLNDQEQKLLTANTIYAKSVEIKVTRSWFAVVAICEPNNEKG